MVSTGGFAGLCTALAVSTGAPGAIWLLASRRISVSLLNVMVGALTFFVMVIILEAGLHSYLLSANPVTTAWFATHRIAFALYAIAAAALFEETGRAISLRFFVHRTVGPGAGFAYGIGHGGLESIVAGTLPQVRAVYIAWMLNTGRFGEVLANYPPVTQQHMLHEFDALTFFSAAYAGVERLTAIFIQIALSLLMWRAVAHRKWQLVPIAIAVHAAMDLPAALLQAGYLSPLPVTSFYSLVGVLLLALFAGRFFTARSA